MANKKVVIKLKPFEEEIAKSAFLAHKRAFKTKVSWKELTIEEQRSWYGIAGAVLVRRYEQMQVTLQDFDESGIKDVLDE